MQISRGWFSETAFGKLRLITREAGETKEAKPTGARRVVPSGNRVSDWSEGTPVYDDAPTAPRRGAIKCCKTKWFIKNAKR